MVLMSSFAGSRRRCPGDHRCFDCGFTESSRQPWEDVSGIFFSSKAAWIEYVACFRALHIAGRAGLINAVEKLLLAGANPMITDETDQTAAAACAVDQNAADCLSMVICGMFPESTPMSRLSAGGGNRISMCGQNIVGKGDVIMRLGDQRVNESHFRCPISRTKQR